MVEIAVVVLVVVVVVAVHHSDAKSKCMYISSVVSYSAFTTVAVVGCEVQVLRPLWSLWKGMAEV